jgi:hypothetical protein
MNSVADTPIAGQGVSLHETEIVSSLPVRHLCDWSVELEPVQIVPTPVGTRMIYVLKRGRCSGDRLRGEFVPGGGDWLLVGQDSVARVDVRVTLRTDDGELIFVTNSGVISMSPEALERLSQGETIRWDEMYTRTVPHFETSSEKYGWLTSIQAISINEIGPERIDYRIYEVL